MQRGRGGRKAAAILEAERLLEELERLREEAESRLQEAKNMVSLPLFLTLSSPSSKPDMMHVSF